MEQAPVKIGQYVLGKNLGIGAFGKVRSKIGNISPNF
jgi:5'-AMP-activated protein kinase catalytic alpha subunit